MSASRVLRTEERDSASMSRWYWLSLGMLFACVVVMGLSTGTVSATQDGNQTSAPTFQSGEKINTTAVELLFDDDSGIDTGSISKRDFLLSSGDISHVSVSAAGTNATVTLVLQDPIDSDQLTVGVRSEASIQDVDGNRIQTDDGASTVTIGEMDGVPPQILATSVTDAIGGPAEIRFTLDEELSALDVTITGAETVSLDVDDFETVGSNEYLAEYTPPESGEYTMTLERLTDTSGNSAIASLARTFDASRTHPEAAIGIDFGASSSFNITFDGGQSRGERLSFSWDFGDGTTAEGQRVSHEFDAGVYDVTLTVTDEFGNSGADVVELNLTGGLEDTDVRTPDGDPGDPTVLVTRGDPPRSPTALVSVTGARAGQSVAMGTADNTEPVLVAEDAVALDAMTITPTVNTSFSLALTAIPTSGITDAAGSGTTVVGGFSLLGDFAGPTVERGSLTFSVDTGTLERRSISAESIVLHSERGGKWQVVDTSRVSQTNDTIQFRSTVREFSRFAVAGTATPDQGEDSDEENETDGDNSTDENTQSETLSVTNATVTPTVITPGEFVEVTATVENRGNETALFRPGLEIDGTVVEVANRTAVESNSTASVLFNRSLDRTGNVTLSVNGTAAGKVRVNGTSAESESQYDNEVFNVTSVTLNETNIGVGESVWIEANVRNEADETANFLAEIAIDGEVVETVEVPQVPPNAEIPVPRVTRQFNESGTYNVSVSGVQSGEQLSVGQSSGLYGFLGFLPLGLIRTGVAFLGVPLLFIYLLLKSVAFYLGY